jgi:nicotinamide-nucleotide amidase
MSELLEKLVTVLGQQLKRQGLRLATAESCTGGGLSYWITSVPGSSDWFERGFVTYSNAAKIEMLGVNSDILKKYGAVSAEVAREMAEGVLAHSPADISIAITGIAGPTGGSIEKPVGTVYIAWAKRDDITQTEMAVYSGDRQAIRHQAIQQALEKIRL